VENAISVLFIPKTVGDDTIEDGGGYPSGVVETFEPQKFPCGVMGAGSMNACCIKDVMDSYRTLSSFETHMSTVDFTNCTTTPLPSGVVVEGSLSDGSSSDAFNFLEGKFACGDTMYSEVVIVDSSSDGLTGTAMLRLDEKEVRLFFGTLTGNVASEYTVTMFVGMVSFVPTKDENNNYANFMQVYHSQTPISLKKTNAVQYVLNAAFTMKEEEIVIKMVVALAMSKNDFTSEKQEAFTQGLADTAGVTKESIRTVIVEEIVVKMVVGMAMSKEDFTYDKEHAFKQGLADTAGVSIERVRIASIDSVGLRNQLRHLLAGSLSVSAEVIVDDTTEGDTMSTKLTAESINRQMGTQGLPEVEVVQSGSVEVGISISAEVIVESMSQSASVSTQMTPENINTQMSTQGLPAVEVVRTATVAVLQVGGFSQTFLNYVGTVLHNVKITEGNHAGKHAQFIQLSFTMPERYQPPGGTNGKLIPFSSVRVGRGSSFSPSSVIEWQYPCAEGSGESIYGRDGISTLYEEFTAKMCAPPGRNSQESAL